MTLTDETTETPTTEVVPAPAAATKERRRSHINILARTVTITEPDGTSLGTYALDDLPDPIRAWCALEGLRNRLRMGEPAAEFIALKSGQLPAPKVVGAKPLDPWREAIAHATAEEHAKSSGVAIRKGGKETPEYVALLDQFRERARGVDKAALRAAKRMPSVVAHYHRLSGGSGSAADLLA